MKGWLKNRGLKTILGFFLLITSFTQAQEYNFSDITLHDGLPSSQINCIYQDIEGFIWIGTNEGIKKYAGKTFIDIYAKNSVSASRPIKSIAESDGFVWFATDRSLYKCVGNYAEEYPLFTKTNPILINQIIPASDSLVYVLTTLGVWQFKDGQFTQVYTNLKIDVDNILCGYLHKHEHELWLGSDGSGLYVLNTRSNTLEPGYKELMDTLGNQTIKTINSFLDVKMYISVFGKGVMEYDFTNMAYLETPQNGLLNNTTGIFTGSNGDIWFATMGDGLIKFSEKKFEIFLEGNGLAENNLLCVNSDSYGNIWTGTVSSGVSVLLKENCLLYNSRQGLPGDNCKQILKVNDKEWFLVTSGGVCLFNGEYVKPFNYEGRVSGSSCADFSQAKEKIAIGFSKGIVQVLDFEKRKKIIEINCGAEIVSIKLVKDSLILIGTRKQGLLQYDLKEKRLTEVSSQLNNLTIWSIANDGNIFWVGTDRGLYFVKDGKVAKLIDKDNQLSESIVYSVSCSNNYVFAATNGFGIFKYNKPTKMLEQFERKQGLYNLVIKSIYANNDNEIYATSSNGLYKLFFSQNEINIKALIENFNRNNAEFMPGSLQPGFFNTLFIGTSKGLLVYNETQSDDAYKGLLVKLTAVQLFNDTTNWTSQGIKFNSKTNLPDSLVLPYNKNDITFRYEVFNLIGEHKFFLKYQLDGFDKKWIFTEKTNRAIYSNLPNGEYTFFVSVSYDGLNWSAPASFSFVIEPPFWKTTKFFVLVMVLLISIVMFLVRFYKSYRDDLINPNSASVEYKLPNIRIILTCGSILIPVSGFVYAVVFDEYDGKLFYQLTVGAFMFVLNLLTYTVEFFKKQGRYLLLLAFYVVTFLYLSMIYLTKLSPFYFTALVLIINISHIVLNKVRPFLIYASFVLVGIIFLSIITRNPVYSPGLFITIVITSIILTLISIQIQLNLNERLFFADNTINAGNSLVIASNKEAEIIFVSKNFERLLGYTEEELMGIGWWKIRSDDPNYNIKVRESVINKTIPGTSIEKIIDKHGNLHWIQWQNNFFDNDMVVGIGVDVTDKKEIEERYQHIVESASDIIFTTDSEGYFVFVNEVGARISGYSIGELLDMNFTQLVRADYRKKVSMMYQRQLRSQTEESYVEFPFVTKSGIEIWVGQSARLYHDENNPELIKGFYAICRDITERIVAEQQLKLYNEKLKLVNEIKVGLIHANSLLDVIHDTIMKLATMEDYRRVSITLPDFENKVLKVHYYEATSDSVKFRKQEGLEGYDYEYFLKNNVLLINDVLNNIPPGISATSEDFKKIGVSSFLVVAIKKEETLIGNISIASPLTNCFTQNDVIILSDLAESLVLGIEQITYRKEISEKNKDISDNIEYSKRIQGAIMPPESHMQSLIPESFIIFKQRDVIGGDFYWCGQIGTKIFVAVGDCTGHGVSGALMSILCSNIITQAVEVHNMFDTGLILDFLNKRIKESLHQYEGKEEIVLDGLDVSLMVIDLKYKVLMFSGAMHNLYLMRKGELTEIKGNRIPIGGIASEMNNRFTTQMYLLYPDLRIYMSTDGYFDQFNGATIKKFSKARFKKLLADMTDMPISKQKGFIWKKHVEWKGSSNQTDDICVFGCSVKQLLDSTETK
ncbi:MAG TPA: PAS domain S-box protein [Bacteroidia bacterium]|nr:PAS domain S-box protein [Bacteroidia bacterium]